MAKDYRIIVFGKTGCEKCKVLNQRLDDLLANPEWADFEKDYVDLLSGPDALVAFCKNECLNPQRIPAFVIARRQEDGTFKPMANPNPGQADDVCRRSKLYQYMGLQTDYSDDGRGVITPRMIAAVLTLARAT